MKKILITLFVISMLAVSLGFVIADKPTKFDSQGNEVGWESAHQGCARIQDGTIYYGRVGSPNTEIIPIGYDKWGYNYQAHMFNGLYCNNGRPDTVCTEDDTYLMMKWSDEWLANTDCNGDGKLDRGYSCDTINADSSGCPGAWLTNHQSGSYELDGKTCNWNYFVKIVAVPVDAYEENGVWYTIDGTEIGEVIWGAFAIIQQVENDACAGLHGQQYNAPAPAGFGFYKPKLLVDTVEVLANNPNPVESNIILESGVEYELEAMGTAFAGGKYTEDIEFDAKYSITHSKTGDTWTDAVTDYEGYGVDLLNLKVNDVFVDWGAYNLEHTYYWTLTGTDAPVELLIYDIHYPNNVGFITVNIYEHQ